MKWPNTPEQMDVLLGCVGSRIPDGPSTPGRNKTVWELVENVTIIFEQHPYHSHAPSWHRGPHWHFDVPGAPHQRFLPGDDMPTF